jgi:hypothetical protein
MALLTLYILPTLIAAIRGTENLGWIIVLNLLPTGIGWLAALIAALALPWRERLQPRDELPDVLQLLAVTPVQAPQADEVSEVP